MVAPSRKPRFQLDINSGRDAGAAPLKVTPEAALKLEAFATHPDDSTPSGSNDLYDLAQGFS